MRGALDPKTESMHTETGSLTGEWGPFAPLSFKLKIECGPALLGATDAAVSRGAGSDPLVIGYKNKTNPSTHTTLVSHEYTESTLSIKCTSDET